MIVSSARLLVATAWVGSLWTIGYLVAPTLFATLPDRVLAGTIAGSLFRIEAWLSVAAALLLALLHWAHRDTMDARLVKRRLLLIVAMLLCTLIGYFGLQPFMAALREAAGPGGVMSGATRTQFGIVHGMASVFYLLQSVLGIVLISSFRERG